MRRISKWLKNHKPLDYKWIIIIFLLIKLLKADLIWFIFFMVGFVSYPSEIDHIPIIQKAGERISEIYTNAMIKIYDFGFSLGESLYPHNSWISSVFIYGLWTIISLLIIGFVIWLINSIMYYRHMKKIRSEKGSDKQ